MNAPSQRRELLVVVDHLLIEDCQVFIGILPRQSFAMRPVPAKIRFEARA